METKKLENHIWVEKYRPKKFEDVLNLDKRIPALVNQNMPHLMFYGPAGTGKSTVCRIIIRELGCDYMALNGSDERGIDTIRDKVKMYVMTKSSKEGMFKVVLMEEMDALTPPAQDVLRNLMETYAKNCRFLFNLNYIGKVIDPIQSRCVKFSFNKVSDEELLKHLKKVCDLEKVKHKDDALKKIIQVSRGDIRKSINMLQQNCFDGVLADKIVGESNIKEIVDKIKAGRYDDVVAELIKGGVDYEQVSSDFFEYIKTDKTISLDKRKRIVIALADCLFEMSFSMMKDISFNKFLIRLEEILV